MSSNPQTTVQQIDFNTILNVMLLMVVMVMMFKMMNKVLEPEKRPKTLYPGKAPPGYKPLSHQSSNPGQHGTCYEDAWRFLIKEEEGYLIHGTILSDGKRIGHAWVETLPGYVWEPQTKRFYDRGAFQKIAEPVEESRYPAEEAAIMAARTGNLGPWTEEERKTIIEHHSSNPGTLRGRREACIQDIAEWYPVHRREMGPDDLRPIALRHFPTDKELTDFYEWLASSEGEAAMRKRLRFVAWREGLISPLYESYYRVTDSGDTVFSPGDTVSVGALLKENERVIALGQEPALAEPAGNR